MPVALSTLLQFDPGVDWTDQAIDLPLVEQSQSRDMAHTEFEHEIRIATFRRFALDLHQLSRIDKMAPKKGAKTADSINAKLALTIKVRP